MKIEQKSAELITNLMKFNFYKSKRNFKKVLVETNNLKMKIYLIKKLK